MAAEQNLTLVERWRIFHRFMQISFHFFIGAIIAVFNGAAFVQHRPYQQPFIRWWHSRLCKILNIEVRVQGRRVKDKELLWVSNHVSWLDIPVLGSRFPVYFLSKAEIAQWPVVGWFSKIAGTLFIKRGAGDAGQITEQLSLHLQEGRQVLFFPEGTTTDGTGIKRFFHHLFSSAVSADAPVQPVVLRYSDENNQLHPSAAFGDISFFSHAMGILKEKKVIVDVVLLPIEPVNERKPRALAKDVEVKMAETLKSMNNNAE